MRLIGKPVWTSWFVTGTVWISRMVSKFRSGRSSYGSLPQQHVPATRASSSWPKRPARRTSRTETIPWDRPFSREERERLARCPVVQLRRRPRRSSRPSVTPTSRSWRTSRLGVYPESNRRADGGYHADHQARGLWRPLRAARGRHLRRLLPRRWVCLDTTAVGARSERLHRLGAWGHHQN